MDRLTKAMDKYLSDVTKVTEQKMVNSKLAFKALDMAEHRKRLLFLKVRSFGARIPRKLKKAARYGIERRIYPTTEEKETSFGHAFIRNERVEFVVVGKRTKWKAKARLACIKEYKRQLAYMWMQSNRMIMW